MNDRRASLSLWLLKTWLPVIVMVVAIAIESTHAFSSNNTSGWMRSAYEAIAGRVTDTQWLSVHHHIRKTGHFTGYGLMGVAWVRAWLMVWRLPLRLCSRGTRRALSMTMAVFCTALVAGLDELHQSYMADRTGVVSDVLLDTAGAVVLAGLYLLVRRLSRTDYRMARRDTREV